MPLAFKVRKILSGLPWLMLVALPTIAARVVVTTAGGKIYELSQPAARGSDTNPMSDKDLEDKLRDAAASWNPRHDVALLIDAIWNVDKRADIAKLSALTVPRH